MSPGQQHIDHSAAADLLRALDLAVFERRADGTFASVGVLPGWFTELRPDWLAGEAIPLTEAFLFLEVFLPDCEEAWASGSSAPVQSDVWAESGPSGEDRPLQAVAVRAGGRPFLLLYTAGGAFHERTLALQRAH